jgi:capsule assembly protein Wzi
MDSWMYPAVDRLHALGYVDTAFLGLRPWTRMSIEHMLQESSDVMNDHPQDQAALEIFLALRKELSPEEVSLSGQAAPSAQLESVYSNFRGITATPLRDSYHLGQTIVNDYGRPYQQGFNNYTGFSSHAQGGRFSLYVRGEFQHAPAAPGYSLALAQTLSGIDFIPYDTNPKQDTIPQGPIASADTFRVLEANAAFHLLAHEISFGKNDHWLGPAQGASMSWSTNAENIYAFEINRVEPLRIPFLSRFTGPLRYDFYVGSLKGHTYPNSPWVHVEKISLKPTRNLEFGFERTSIWGGKGHSPITIHTFLKSFFSLQNVSLAEKFSREDPGARFGSFDFNYRLPFVRSWLSLYSDSEVHDDVSPVSAPRRAAVRPGLYLSHFPKAPALDLRVEGASTMPVSNEHLNGNFLYYESVQRQGPTNKGFLFTDWIGRDAKGGQAWLTYHLSPSENVQLMYRNSKADRNFIPFGTTQNIFDLSVVKRIRKDFEVRAHLQQEWWKAPIYKPGLQRDTTISTQVTWYLKQSRQF